MSGEPRERITINCPVGTSGDVFRTALDVGRGFASAYIDRRPRDIVVYVQGSARYVAWWTKARAVSVRVDAPDV